jgi:hypothetical protein
LQHFKTNVEYDSFSNRENPMTNPVASYTYPNIPTPEESLINDPENKKFLVIFEALMQSKQAQAQKEWPLIQKLWSPIEKSTDYNKKMEVAIQCIQMGGFTSVTLIEIPVKIFPATTRMHKFLNNRKYFPKLLYFQGPKLKLNYKKKDGCY